MPTLTGRFDWHEGLCFRVVLLSPHDTSITHPCLGLVDTGANVTALAPHIIEKLHLQPKDTACPHYTADTIDTTTIYNGPHVTLVNGTEVEVKGEKKYVVLRLPNVVAFRYSHKLRYEALLGRDLLWNGTLIMRMDGQYTFAYGEPIPLPTDQ